MLVGFGWGFGFVLVGCLVCFSLVWVEFYAGLGFFCGFVLDFVYMFPF